MLCIAGMYCMAFLTRRSSFLTAYYFGSGNAIMSHETLLLIQLQHSYLDSYLLVYLGHLLREAGVFICQILVLCSADYACICFNAGRKVLYMKYITGTGKFYELLHGEMLHRLQLCPVTEFSLINLTTCLPLPLSYLYSARHLERSQN